MVVKTEECHFSKFRIYPGHGRTFVRKDGRPLTFISSKTQSLHHQRKKAAKITWTQAWRMLNKKGQKDENSRSRKRRTQKFTRTVVGISIDELKKRKNQKPEYRAAARQAALREVKERQRAAKAKKAAGKASGGAGAKAANKVKKGGNVAKGQVRM